jgi:hypothetical protein
MARNAIASLIMVLAVSAVAHAQDDARFGVVIAYPGSIGAEWHVSERVALRPDFTFSFNGNESTNTISSPFATSSTSSSSGKSIGVGLSALFYVKRWDALRLFIAPRFGFIRATATTTNDNAFPGGSGPPEIRNLNSTYVTSGSVGAQYRLGQRFALFGEVGAAYSDVESSTGFAGAVVETSGWSVSSRAGVGAVIYF